MANQNKIIGIDLGTTNSCAAVIEGGKPIVITNSEGNRTTPSVVSFDQNGGRLVGLPAKRQAIKHPDRTIQSIKRFMGTDHRVQIDHMNFSPEQISACLLTKLKKEAQAHLNEKVNRAIITVPAYFDDAQRLATRHAGEIAGLEVVRVINEPTACALAYGFNKLGQEANIVIFDFGGGTFDVTILQLYDGILQVKATNGNNRLGGDDFDDRIIKFLLEQFKKQNGIDLSDDAVAMQRLKEAAEKAKIELSGIASTQIQLPFLSYADGSPLHLETELFQKEFNDFTADLVKATGDPINKALADAKIQAEKVDHVVLVGGTTRIPAVQQFIRSYFHKEPVKSVNPDEAVALGAAVQGGILTGEIQEVLLLDVIPLTLGIEGPDGKFNRIVERNTTIPVSRTHTFTTTESNQAKFSVHVLQGEEDLANKNTSLARFELTNIPPGPAGTQKVDVVFDIDADGIFQCTARSASGERKELVLKRTTGYSPEELKKLKNEEASRSQHEEEEANRLAAAVLLESSITDAERLINRLAERGDSPEIQQMRLAVEKLRAVLSSEASTQRLEELRVKLETMMTNLLRPKATH